VAVAPHRYRVEGDVDAGILNGLVHHASGTLPAHLHHEFALEFRGEVTAHHELRIVILDDLARDRGTICKEENELRLKRSCWRQLLTDCSFNGHFKQIDKQGSAICHAPQLSKRVLNEPLKWMKRISRRRAARAILTSA